MRVPEGVPRYTVDGTEVTPDSAWAHAPVLVTTNTVIALRGFKGSRPFCDPLKQCYTVIQQDIKEFRSGLPVVVINSLGGEFRARERIPTWITVLTPTNGCKSFWQRVVYSGRAEVGLRGSSTLRQPKKPFRVEFQDEDGDDFKVPILGMPKESDWILFPAARDASLMRDLLAYELWRQMGYYTPQGRYVELFVVRDDHRAVPLVMGDYEGVYVLMEKIKRGSSRLRLEKLRSGHNSEPEITGGYIFKRDRPNPEEEGFGSTRGIRFAFEEPKERTITPAQRHWLTNHINTIETVLFGEMFADPALGYRRFIDVDSFVDFHWMTELSLNIDGYAYSVFLHKDRNAKLRMGPLWDFDLSFGNILCHGRFAVDGWQWQRGNPSFYEWYNRLFADADFLQSYIDRWQDLRQGVLSTTNVLSILSNLRAQLPNDALARNYQRWPDLGKLSDGNRAVGDKYEDHYGWLKRWMQGRLEWIDRQGFPAPTVRLATAKAERRLELTGGIGTIYYTEDRSDPRLRGGGVSPRAREYHSPLVIERHQELFIRARSPFHLWSPPLMVDTGHLEDRQESSP